MIEASAIPAGARVSRIPDLFIIGAPKCGTTSLFEYLKGHPQVFMSAVKEPNYYARDLALDPGGQSLRYGLDEARYLALFNDAGGAKRAGEGSTRYLYSLDAAQLTKAASPDARIVAMVRNPVDMIRSLYDHKVAAGTEDLPDLAQALAAEDDRHAGRRIPEHSNPKLATYRDRARFSEQLARWFDVYGRDRVHVIVLEDMIANPASEFRRLLEFLDVDPDWKPASFETHNAAHGSRSRTLQRVVLSRPMQWAAWRALPRIIGDARARQLVSRFSHSDLRRRKIVRTPLPPALRSQLEDDFMPDVKLLSTQLGHDLAALWFGRVSAS